MKRRSFVSGIAKGAAALPLVGAGLSPDSLAGAHYSATDRDALPDPAMQRAQSRQWFQDARFGMFIHWGVYSVLGKGEWVMNNDRITAAEYSQLPARFNPSEFDAVAWARLAREAGMRYITITSKHHDGFAMWDSAVGDFNIVNATPYGQDVLKMLADACEQEGLKLFFYHSHLDWRHPDYFPRGRTGLHSGRRDSGDFDAYLEFMNAQIQELATGYGKLGGFWFDGWWDQQLNGMGQPDAPAKATQVDWKLRETYELINRLQPQAIISNNHHVSPFPGEDVQIFERDLPGTNTAGFNTTVVSPLPLESCDTINGSWGYHEMDMGFKSHRELVGYLVRSAGRNANLLLNVGPTPRGSIQPEFQERLRAMGRWLDRYGASIYGTRVGPMPEQSWGVSTQKGWTVYVHVLDSEAPEMLELPGTRDLTVDGAHLLDGDAEVSVTRHARGNLMLRLPLSARSDVDTVVNVELTG
jgi:alpha-L-fucosidase